MAVIIKAKKGDSAGSLIRRYKKAISGLDLVQKARDRRYHKKPSQIKAEKLSEKRHLQKRLRSLKVQKNVSPESLDRLRAKINSL